MKKDIFNLQKWQEPGFSQKFIIVFLFLILCLIVLIRYQIQNEFTLLSGDRYDSLISATILEHWFQFFSANAEWTEVNYFYPYKNTLANTDAFFLNGISYLPFRFFGFDPFISGEFAVLIVKSIGFIGAYFLSRRAFLMSFYWSILAAVLFTLSNGMTVHSSRYQLATVAFFPVMALLLWHMVEAIIEENLNKFRFTGVISAILFGAWCLTCFYMAWFFIFFLTIFFAVISVLTWRTFFPILKNRINAHYGSIIFVGSFAVLSLLPFLYVFIPKSIEVGVRSYEDAHNFTLPIQGVLQVGRENLLFGNIYNDLLLFISPLNTPYGEYYNTGFPIILFILFVLGCIQTIKRVPQSSGDLILKSLVFTSLFTWITTLNFFGHSAWYFIYHAFPGAKALRVVSAYQIFLALPVIIISLKYLSTKHLRIWVLIVLSIVLVAEELNKPVLQLDRFKELDRISLPALPPKSCRAFYTSGWEGQEGLGVAGNLYAHNVTAMYIANIANIPTINGIASFNPPGFNFADPNNYNYDDRIYYYSKLHGVTDLCKLNLNSKQWTLVNQLKIENAFLSVPFFKESNWEGRIWIVEGLYDSEDWGTWSSNDVVTIEFNTNLPEKFAVHLTARAFGPNVGENFEARVGNSYTKFKLAANSVKRVFILDNVVRSKILTIKIPRAISPMVYTKGENKDVRRLGIGFESLKIIPLQ